MITKREIFVQFRVNPKEKQALHILASLENRKPSELIRELIRDGIQKHDLDFYNLENEVERFNLTNV